MDLCVYFLDGSSLVGELTKTIGTLNPCVQALTGINIASAVGQKLSGSGSASGDGKGRGK